MKITLVEIAKSCHAINAALCAALGDNSQVPWDEAPMWQRHSAINGVALHVMDPHMSPAMSHESWMAQKAREGWKYGKVKDAEKLTHPSFLPYDELAPEVKAKDFVFKAVVAQLAPYLGANDRANAAIAVQEFHAANAAGAKSENDAETAAETAAGPSEDEEKEPDSTPAGSGKKGSKAPPVAKADASA